MKNLQMIHAKSTVYEQFNVKPRLYAAVKPIMQIDF